MSDSTTVQRHDFKIKNTLMIATTKPLCMHNVNCNIALQCIDFSSNGSFLELINKHCECISVEHHCRFRSNCKAQPEQSIHTRSCSQLEGGTLIISMFVA